VQPLLWWKSNKYFTTYSERVSIALGAQHTKRMRRIFLSSVVCPAEQYIPTFSHKRCGFLEKITERKICVLISLQLVSEIFLILRRI
jgi:hypothetical protein